MAIEEDRDAIGYTAAAKRSRRVAVPGIVGGDGPGRWRPGSVLRRVPKARLQPVCALPGGGRGSLEGARGPSVRSVLSPARWNDPYGGLPRWPARGSAPCSRADEGLVRRLPGACRRLRDVPGEAPDGSPDNGRRAGRSRTSYGPASDK